MIVKRLYKAIFTLSVIVALFSKASFAVSVGTAPGVMEIGEVEPGTNVPVEFYLLSTFKSDVIVDMSYIEPHRTLYLMNHTGRYKFDPWQASEEPIKDWITFQQNPVVVPTKPEYVVYFPSGEVVKANQKVTLMLNIPENAEPGYHAFSINLAPRYYGGGGTISTIAVTRPLFIFRIPGKVVRDGKIEGILADREDDGRVRIDVLFRNTGTVTLKARISGLEIYDEKGKYIKTLQSGWYLVPPNEAKVLSVYWTDNKETEQKTHRMIATIDFTTGAASAEDMVAVPPYVIKEVTLPKPKMEIPFWLIIFIIGMLFILAYWRYG